MNLLAGWNDRTAGCVVDSVARRVASQSKKGGVLCHVSAKSKFIQLRLSAIAGPLQLCCAPVSR
jgi:hypothetical protein